MSTATHTPWTCGPSFSPSEYGITITDSRGYIVASTYAEYGPLLAAAPALLAALREAETALDAVRHGVPAAFASYNATHVRKARIGADDESAAIEEETIALDAVATAEMALVDVRAALAKAEGREP